MNDKFDWTVFIPSTQNIIALMGAATITACVMRGTYDAQTLMGIAAAFAFLSGGHGAGRALVDFGNRLQGGSTAPAKINAPVPNASPQPEVIP